MTIWRCYISHQRCPSSLNFPTSIPGGSEGQEITLVGFGRSGFGSYGYTSNTTFTDRRVGWNVIDGLESDDEGGGLDEIFIYDFDAPDSGDSPGNDLESMIAPGDSGGPALEPVAFPSWESTPSGKVSEGNLEIPAEEFWWSLIYRGFGKPPVFIKCRNPVA